MYGPSFGTASTYISSAPATPAPPITPTTNIQPQNPLAVTPHSSATVALPGPNPAPVALPYIYIERTAISSDKVETGSPVQVSAYIKNKGTVNGTTSINVYVNGYIEASQGITLASGEGYEMVFMLYKTEPGTYRVYVNSEHAGNFIVSDTMGSNLILAFSCICLLAALVLEIILIRRRISGDY